jgi:hypothetical protein
MVRVKQHREAVREALPAGSELGMSFRLTQSGRTAYVNVREESEPTLMWGYAVARCGANQLMLRLPKEAVNVRKFVAKKINQAIWGDNKVNYYKFTA